MTIRDSAPAGLRTQADCQAVDGNSYPKTIADFQLLKQESLKKQGQAAQPVRQNSFGKSSPKPQTPSSSAGRSLLQSRSMQSRAPPTPSNQAPAGNRTEADMEPVDNYYPKTVQEFQVMKKQASIKSQAAAERTSPTPATPTKTMRTSVADCPIHGDRASYGTPSKTERTSPVALSMADRSSLGTPTKPERTSAASLSMADRSSLGTPAKAERTSPAQPATPDSGRRTLMHFQSLQNRTAEISKQAPAGFRTNEDVQPVGGDYYPKTLADLQQLKKQASTKQTR